MYTTTNQNLIDVLRTRSPEAQVFVMTQRENPHESHLVGVVGREEMIDQRFRVEDGVRVDDIFLVVGSQIRPGSLSAWFIAEDHPPAQQPTNEVPRTSWQLKLEQIAADYLRLETLEVRNVDRLDVHDIHVASVRRALTAAYRAGVTAGVYCAIEPDDADVPDDDDPGGPDAVHKPNSP